MNQHTLRWWWSTICDEYRTRPLRIAGDVLLFATVAVVYVLLAPHIDGEATWALLAGPPLWYLFVRFLGRWVEAFGLLVAAMLTDTADDVRYRCVSPHTGPVVLYDQDAER